MCIALLNEPYGSRMTHLPVCERQPLWEGSERIGDAYSLRSQRFSLALSFPQPSPLLGRTDGLNHFHDFSRQISPLCVLCSIMRTCNLWAYAKGGWGRRKAGDWGRKPGRGRGIAAGLPPFPGLSPQEDGKPVLRIPSTQSIKNKSHASGHSKSKMPRRIPSTQSMKDNTKAKGHTNPRPQFRRRNNERRCPHGE